jgi:membrane-associated protease RseP (regulator of RpoE activity)
MDNISFSDLLGSAWGITLVVAFFGGSIFVHELGHFLAARKRGLKIERFSIGFGPRLFGWTGKDGVDYRVSIIPLGGYVALPQLAEMEGIEGASSEDAEKLPPISYADKMIVSVMGAVFNVIFAFILACIIWVTGIPVAEGTGNTVIGYVPERIVVGDNFLSELGLGESIDCPAHIAGLRAGDKVISIDDIKVSNFGQIQEMVKGGNRKDSQGNPTATFVIERNGKTEEKLVQLGRNTKAGLNDLPRFAGIEPPTQVVLSTPTKDSPAEKAGIKAGDRVLSIDGHAINHKSEFIELLRKGGTRPRTLLVERADGVTEKITVTPQVQTIVNPVAAIDYGSEKERHTLILVPATRDLLTNDTTAPRDQLMVLSISPEDASFADVLKIGTTIDKVDGLEKISAIRSISDLLNATGGTARDITIYWKRANGDAGNLTLKNAKARQPEPFKHALIGVTFEPKYDIAYYNPIESCVGIIKSTYRTLGRLFDRGSDVQVKHMAGVVTISKTYYNLSKDIRLVLWFTVLINLNLAVMNLLPIPVLDGGHMLIATIQRFTKGLLSNKAVIILQYTFMALLLSLMAYIILHDVRRCSGDSELQLKKQFLERHVYKPQEFSAKK